MESCDFARLKGHIKVEKFAEGVDPRSPESKPYEVIEGTNLFLTVGINEIWDLMTGASANHFNNTDSRIGIGNDKATAPADTQTDLIGASKTYKAMDATFPTAASNKQLQFKSVFGSSDANYEWGEMCVKHNVSLKVINRSTNAGAGWGTKTVGTSWTITVTLSLA